jgi:uncharacterized membrane protein YhaH (DUF805 family)
MNNYVNVLKKFSDFSGRATRREFWMFLLFNALFAGVTFGIDVVMLLSVGVGFANILYMLAVFVPGVAVTVRRLHDTGRSGWWILIALVPVAGLALLVLLCLDSEPAANRFGANPKLSTDHSGIGRLAAS